MLFIREPIRLAPPRIVYLVLAGILLGGCNKNPSGPANTSSGNQTVNPVVPNPVTPNPTPPPSSPSRELHSLQLGKIPYVRSALFLPDGHHALLGNGVVLDLDAWKQERRLDFQMRQLVSELVLLPDNRRILASSWDTNAYLFDLQTGKQLHRYQGHSANVNCVAVSSDGRRALTGGQSDKTLRLWDVETAKPLANVARFNQAVHRVAFLPGDRQALAGAGDVVHIMDIDARKDVRSFEGKWNGLGSCLILTADSKHVLSAAYTPKAELVYWNLQTGEEVRRFGPSSGLIWSIALSPDGRRALSADSKFIIHLWDVESGKELHSFSGHTGNIGFLAFSPDGRHALSIGQDETARYWQLPQ